MALNPAIPIHLTDLTLPRESTGTVRGVLNGYLREALRAFTTLPGALLPEPARSLYLRTSSFVRRGLPGDPRHVVRALRPPSHGALLWTLLRECTPGGDRELLGTLLTELCLLMMTQTALGGVAFPGVVDRPGDRWPLLRSIEGGFVLAIEPEVEQIGFAPGGLVLHRRGEHWPVLFGHTLTEDTPARLSHPYHPIVDHIVLAESDNNPLRMFEAHPEKAGNPIDLGGHPVEEWVRTLRECFALIDQQLPLIGEEMRLVLRAIVPVGYHDQRHFSASYQEAIGTIYLTLHPNLMTMTEALVHEYQHNKLNAAIHLGPLLHNAFWPLYSSPVRPDPRPLHGVVLAVHAFQTVARLYQAMTESGHPLAQSAGFRQRFRDILRMDHAGARTVLENGDVTPYGSAFFDEMASLDAELLAYESAHWSDAPTAEPPPLPE